MGGGGGEGRVILNRTSKVKDVEEFRTEIGQFSWKSDVYHPLLELKY